jgi:hypothetical protein
MPINNPFDARDEIVDHFTTIWNAQASPPPLLYQDRRRDLPASGSYARITVNHNTAPQVTLGGKTSLGGSGERFRNFGIVTVQIFTDSDDGLTTSDVLVKVALDAFRGQKTGEDRVEFRNTRMNEIGQDGPWHQTNVLAEFDYDEVTT